MPNNTGNRGYTYPTLADSNDVPFYMQTLAEQVDADVSALAATPWTTFPLTSGWAVVTGYAPLRYRKVNGIVEISSTRLRRTTNATVNPAAGVVIANIPAGFRPALIEVSAGTIGVSGTLGACMLIIGTDGNLNVVSMVAGGTMTNGGDWQNHVGVSPITYEAA
ncbi:hypothetical protein ACFWGN_20705 [Oerskovia sp. NPDC060338]|uniref:hypothetical protein n=1 Tax=Oerskovia sp. NPDC060338 TaxID=3347100 RepID=UPI003654373E